jgi:hypothetical protein
MIRSDKPIKRHEYTSECGDRIILSIFAVEDGYVLEQVKITDHDGEFVDTVYIPDGVLTLKLECSCDFCK